MLCPALFIGVGSTGLDILERFQELILEHYGRPALDIYRYVAIETREAADVAHPEWGESRVDLIRPVIRNTDALDSALRAGAKPYLRDWLDPELLKIPGRQFVDGASNIRMAGRLILWENWETIRATLSSAYSEITSDESKARTRSFLEDHYRRTGQSVGDRATLVSGLPSVYLVGTLCGGTCSGMFIDLGYCIKEITGLWAQNLPNPNLAKTLGLFTVFDSATLNGANQQAIQGLAANCWAALKEYDYWCHPETRYQTILPTRIHPDSQFDIDTNERPIDWVYLMSCTATDTRNVISSNLRKGGQPDKESLQHMAAVVLFTETVGGLLQEKDRIRTDYRGRDRAMRRNAAQHSPCIASCGVATVWYPRFRAADGAASISAAQLCKVWMKDVTPDDKDRLSGQARDDCRRILSGRLDRLTSSGSGNIIGDMRQGIDRERERMLALPPGEFVRHLHRLLGQLNAGGPYDSHLSDPGRHELFQKDLLDDIWNCVAQVINERHSIAAGELYLQGVDQVLRDTHARIPPEYPAPDLGWARLGQEDWFTRLVFRHRIVRRQLCEQALERCKGYAEEHIKLIRNHRIRPVLTALRQSLGAQRQTAASESPPGTHTLQGAIDRLRTSLVASDKHFVLRSRQLSAEVPHTQDTRIASTGAEGDIEADIQRLAARIAESVSGEARHAFLQRVTDGRSLSDFLGLRGAAAQDSLIRRRLSRVLLEEALSQVQEFDPAQHVIANWSPADVSDFARHGLPHLELTPGRSNLASLVIGRPVSLVAGRNPTALGQLQQQMVGTECEQLFEQVLHSRELSHMLIFYREEPLMYMDENMSTAQLFDGCYQLAEQSSPYGLHSHRAGKLVFDPRIFDRRKRAREELIPIATKLMSARDAEGHWISSEIFTIERGKLVRRGVRRSGLKFRLSCDDDGIELCAQEIEIFEHLRDAINEKLARIDREELVDRINNHLDWIERRAEAENVDATRARSEEEQRLLGISLIRSKLSVDTE